MTVESAGGTGVGGLQCAVDDVHGAVAVVQHPFVVGDDNGRDAAALDLAPE